AVAVGGGHGADVGERAGAGVGLGELGRDVGVDGGTDAARRRNDDLIARAPAHRVTAAEHAHAAEALYVGERLLVADGSGAGGAAGLDGVDAGAQAERGL